MYKFILPLNYRYCFFKAKVFKETALKPLPFLVGLALSVIVFAIAPTPIRAQAVQAFDVSDNASQLVNQWLSIAQQREALEKQWEEQKLFLEIQIAALEKEKQQLAETLNNRVESTDEVEIERLLLLEEQNQLEGEQENLNQANQDFERFIRTLHTLIPPPLLKSWEEKLNNTEPEPAPSAELQQTLELARLLIEFDSSVLVHEGLISISLNNSEHDSEKENAEQQLMVKQLYLGATKAWFTSPDGKYSGTGFVTPAGWEWSIIPDMDSSSLQKAIIMLETNQTPELVSLPLVLSNTLFQQTQMGESE